MGYNGQVSAINAQRQSVPLLTRRWFLAAAGAACTSAAAGSAYARWIEPTWIEVVRCDLPMPGLPAPWEGLRVVHISDLHLCPWVPTTYLARAIRQVGGLGADLVVVTGDFVTITHGLFESRVADLFADLRPPYGVFACLGNHDYGLTRPVRSAIACGLVDALPGAGVRLLRNDAARLSRDGQDLWVAGVEDLWSGHLDASYALRGVPAGSAVLALCHNPDAAETLSAAGCGAILAGHTHGGQVHLPLLGPPILPVTNRRRYRGLHRVGNSWLYVNRGLGWLWRVRLLCRPEITVLTLRRATGGASAGPAGG